MICFDDSLTAHLDRYLLDNPCSKKHAANLQYRVALFDRWSGFSVTAGALSVEHVNRFLLALEQSRRSPHTVNGYRSAIMAVWNAANGGPERADGRVRRLKVCDSQVHGWRRSEVKQLLRIAKGLRGRLPNGVRRRDFWCAAIHAGYCTGQRYGDLAKLDVSTIGKGGRCTLIQSKTGKRLTVQFSGKAIKWIARHGKQTVIPNPHTQKWFCDHFSRLVERAGIRGGTFKWLRRTAGSYAEREGRGAELLGNSRAVFEQSYRVDEIVASEPPEPPQL